MGAAEHHDRQGLKRRNGRDEMNLAEFPITLLADRALEGQKTLVFRDGEQTITVTGSDAFGLPTAADADVIVALIQFTKQANGFTDPTVPFSRYGLIRLLGWPLKGSSYKRLTQSFKCWTGVTLNYEKAWWDNKSKRKVDATFHIIESVVISESPSDDEDSPEDFGKSSFTWNKRFFESCRADNLKRLDLDTYFSLRSAVSKRMYRFLDKRFFLRPSWTFDLHELAHEHIGLGRNYSDNGKLKEKLGPAIKELEDIGYLEPMGREERYKRVRRGRWTITFTRKSEAAEEELEAQPGASRWEQELVARGITASKAAAIVERYPADRIERQIEQVEFIQARHPSEIRSLAGYLRKAIEEDYAAPPGFVSKAEQAEREDAARERQGAVAAGRRRQAEAKAQEEKARARISAYLEALSASDLEALDREVLADREARDGYERQFPGFRKLYLDSLRRARIRAKLGLPAPLET